MYKYVIFDLDETLGTFVELSILWEFLQKNKNIRGQQSFNKLCELFATDYFRPGIFNALKYLMESKKKGLVKGVILYTNNTGSLEWLKNIISFLEKKSDAVGLFTELIPGFKPHIKGKYARRHYAKTYNEIIRCAKIEKSAKIIFFDDIYHHMMKNNNVKYIHVAPYFHMVPRETIIRKLQNTKTGFGHIDKKGIKTLNEYMYHFDIHYAPLYNSRAKACNSRVSKNDIYDPLCEFLTGESGTPRHKKSKSVKSSSKKSQKKKGSMKKKRVVYV